MRFTIAYYLLVIYSVVMIRPLIPAAKDFIAHSFFETIHIATIHAVYGSNHLQKEITQSNGDNENNKHQKGAVNEETLIHLRIAIYESNINLSYNRSYKKYFSFCINKSCNGFAVAYTPPPDVL